MSMDERMTICNMSIEGGRARRLRQSGPDRPSTTCAAGSSRRRATTSTRASAWWLSMASDPGAAYDDEVRIDAAAIRPTRDVGHQSGAVGVRRRDAAAARDVAAGERAAIAEALDVHGLRRGRSRSRARRSTSRSSARAPTPGCRICARPRGSSAAITSRRTCRRSSCRDRRRCAPRPSARGSTASSPTRASNGAARAARCAWR